MKKDKEMAFDHYMKVIKESWTYQRLTFKEREKLRIGLLNYKDKLIGNYDQRYQQMSALYSMFLKGVGYEPIGWRETET